MPGVRFNSQPIGRDPRDRRTNYQRGADFERKVRDQLLEEGACYVVRSAGSRGIADLVAFFPGVDSSVIEDTLQTRGVVVPQVWLIQCKRDGLITIEDAEILRDLAAETGCDAWLAFRGDHGSIDMVEVEDYFKVVGHG